jgi:type II secretory pathway component PulC
MIKFKEFLAPSIDVQITDFFKEQAEKNPDAVFEYLDLVAINNDRIMLAYRQTSKSVYQFKSLVKSIQ